MFQLFFNVFSKSLLTVESRWLTKGKRPLWATLETGPPAGKMTASSLQAALGESQTL